MNVLRTVLDAGLELHADGDTLRVSPPERITPALRALIKENKWVLLAAAKEAAAVTSALVQAIHRACDVRGDSDTNREALIQECTALPRAQQAEMQEHFNSEATRWEKASGV